MGRLKLHDSSHPFCRAARYRAATSNPFTTPPPLFQTTVLFLILSVLLCLTFAVSSAHAIAPSFRASTSAATTLPANILTIPKPLNSLLGDTLIAVITTLSPTSGLTVTPPAGWTFIRQDISAGALAQDLFYKPFAAGEPINYTFTFSQTLEATGTVTAYWRADLNNPIDAHSGQFNITTTPTAPSITTTTSGTTLLAIFGTTDGRKLNPPTNSIDRWFGQGVNGNQGFDENFPGSGTTGSRTSSTNQSPTIGQMLALRPASTITPGSAGTVLFVTSGSGTFTDGELLRTSLLEAWGYTILPIVEDDSQANYDAAISQADVAYISEVVYSTRHGNRLRNACIGVVNEETRLTDDLGISSTGSAHTIASTYINNNSHYITQPFPFGNRTLFSTPQPLWALGGIVAPDAVTLAYEQATPNDPTLTVIETGGTLYDSGTAAGRRVELPWGESTMDFSTITANGEQIMQRSVEWAAAANICTRLTKRAFLADGTPLNNETTIPQGTLIKFLIYINNKDLAQNNVSVRDILDPLFAPGYQSQSIKVDNSQPACVVSPCTAAEEASIFAAIDGTKALTDAIDGDGVRFDGTNTIDAGEQNALGNGAINVSANSVWALLFSVTIQ
ncbi:MAG: hypothetical protein IBX47_12005 [Desulfuromonadales bacterium]|nr:hypothetical protein [Desulfuromonadales bacterium]